MIYNLIFSQNESSYINQFKKFSENYNPDNEIKNKGLIVAEIPKLEKKLNLYLNINYPKIIASIDKYAFLIVLKTVRSQLNTTIQSYDLCGTFENPIIKICAYRMNVDLKKLAQDVIGCSTFTTYDIYLWVKDNKTSFTKYIFIQDELNDIAEIFRQKYEINIDTVRYKLSPL